MKTISDLHDLAAMIAYLYDELHNPFIWWRGHSDSTWQLVPSVYRGNRDGIYEKNATLDFIRKAPARYPHCPTDWTSWLFLMQHYGMRTRLLDWTESPLVALFFAVSEYDRKSATLWALNPFALNEDQANTRKIFNPIAPFILDVKIVDDIVASIAKTMISGHTGEETSKIVALHPPYRDMRLVVQQSAFTIHGTTEPLDQLQIEEEFLWKFEIPAAQKKSLLRSLARLGVQEPNLFPDLEHLAKELASVTYVQVP